MSPLIFDDTIRGLWYALVYAKHRLVIYGFLRSSALSTLSRIPNMTDYDILLLKVFDAVVKAGSFTAAEICLNKSKSAISVHISALEARLGQTLCRRGRSGFSLTPEGEQIYAIAKDLFVDLDRFRDRISRVTSLVGGTLTIAIDDGLMGSSQVLADALGRFKTRCPDVFLAVYTTSPERVVQMLVDTTADIGLCAVARDLPGVDLHPLHEERLGLYCSDRHKLFPVRSELITDAMLEGCESVDLGSYQGPEVEATLLPMRSTARSGQASARLLLILTGQMIGLLPVSVAAEWERRGQLREIRPTGRTLTSKFYAVIRREVAASKVHDRMILELKRAFASPQAPTSPGHSQSMQLASSRPASQQPSAVPPSPSGRKSGHRVPNPGERPQSSAGTTRRATASPLPTTHPSRQTS